MNRKITVVGGAGNVGATAAGPSSTWSWPTSSSSTSPRACRRAIASTCYEAAPDRVVRRARAGHQRLQGHRRLRHRRRHVGSAPQAGHEPRRPAAGQLRDHQRVVEQVVEHSPNCIIIRVANPLDAMTQAVYRLSGFPRERVLGMAGILDSARMRTFIAMELDVSVENVHAFVLGGHGDTMVPLPRYSTVAGIPITELLPKERIDAICTRTANGGAEITKLRRHGQRLVRARSGGGARWSTPSSRTRSSSLPCAVFLQGEYGIRDLFLGVPVKLGAGGVEQIIEIKLTAEEDAALKKSAAAVKELVNIVKV